MTTSSTGIPLMPGGLPLAGHTVQLRRRPLEFLRTVRYYGDVVLIRVGQTPNYVINNPDLVHEVLAPQQHRFAAGLGFDGTRDVIGDGIAVSDGYIHHRHRRLVGPAFHDLRLRHYAAAMAEIANARAASWRAGDTVDLKKELFSITVEIAARVLFSADAGQENLADFRRCWPVVLESMGRRATPPFTERIPAPRTRRHAEARDRIRAAVARIITHHRESGVDHGDVLSALLAASDHPNGFLTDQQVFAELMSLLAAGTLEPFAMTCWMLYHLSADREIERRVLAELAGRAVSAADLPKLGYLDRVASEALRMHPPVWLLTRRARSDVLLGENLIPPGSSVMLSPYAMHHDSGLFVYAQHFNPDRWLPERARFIPRHAYVPFADGDRRCVGEGLGRTLARIVTAAIAVRWRLGLPPGERVHETPAAVLTPNRLVVRVDRRD